MAARPAVSVVLPTLNEREAITRLEPRLREATAGFASEWIVVDDDSPDGTAEAVRQLARADPFRLIVRKGRRGLGTAVVEGIRAARGEVIVALDADGSHPPERIAAMVQPVLEGRAELVLGSRRVAGGSAPGLSWDRRVISYGASILARPLTAVRDPMTGFFAVSRAVTERAELLPLSFKIALEILVKCRPDPVIELPIEFAPRIAGESKLGPGGVSAYLRHLAKLYRWRLSDDGRASRTR